MSVIIQQDAPVAIFVAAPTIAVIAGIPESVSVVAVTGAIGPTGAQGPIGPVGPAGSAASTFTYTPSGPANPWTIDHNLGRYPDVVLLLPSGEVVQTDITHTSVNQTVVTWQSPTTGTAYLS